MTQRRNIIIAFTAALTVTVVPVAEAQEREELIAYGDMDRWVTRNIKESGIIGGNTKTLYEVGPESTIEGNNAYTNAGGSPWATSNVYAKVMGVVKTNTSVYRDSHGSGSCAKLVTHVESVRVLGMMNINVIAAGSLYLGDMAEPVTSAKDGPKNLNWGIPFTRRPKALKFDYKTELPDQDYRIKQNGFSRKSTVEGRDYAIVVLYLQRRSEDDKGNVTAQRVGTMTMRIGTSTNGWVEGSTHTIRYGDISTAADFDSELMGLRSDYYVTNSQGKHVPLVETGWADASATPTHIVLQFASSHGGAYIGTPGNTLWVDNVKLVY